MDIEEKILLEKIAKQNEILISLGRLRLPISELPLEKEEKEYLFYRGARRLEDTLVPGFFDLFEAQEHKQIVDLIVEWGYHIEIPQDQKIEDMDFSIRTRNALCRGKVYSLLQLLSMKENDVRKIRNLGVGSINEIKNKLTLLGYDWR